MSQRSKNTDEEQSSGGRDGRLAAKTRRVLHLDVDAFLASVEEVLHPELRGKPLVIGGMPDERNLVMTSSYAAREHGIRPGMRLAEAARLSCYIPEHLLGIVSARIWLLDLQRKHRSGTGILPPQRFCRVA